jgi:hypothetical protein
MKQTDLAQGTLSMCSKRQGLQNKTGIFLGTWKLQSLLLCFPACS